MSSSGATCTVTSHTARKAIPDPQPPPTNTIASPQCGKTFRFRPRLSFFRSRCSVEARTLFNGKFRSRRLFPPSSPTTPAAQQVTHRKRKREREGYIECRTYARLTRAAVTTVAEHESGCTCWNDEGEFLSFFFAFFRSRYTDAKDARTIEHYARELLVYSAGKYRKMD